MAVRVVVLLGLALVIGVGTIIFANRWIEGVRSSVVAPAPQQVEVRPERFVLVAQGNLQPGMLIGPESVTWQGWPTENLPPTYIVQQKRNESEFFGAVVRTRIAAGEPITDFKVAKPGEQGFLAAVLKPGMRAVTVPISDTRASAGFILPGDRVDVLLTHETNAGTVAETIFQDMRVLAIDQALTGPEGGAARVGKTATLEVTPREVEAFTLMQQLGTVSLSLRSLQPVDPSEIRDDEQQTPGLMAGELMSEKPEDVEKIPTVYPGGEGEQFEPAPLDDGTNSAIGESLGEVEVVEDIHAERRRNQTFTTGRDVSVLIGGGGGGGSVVIIRGN